MPPNIVKILESKINASAEIVQDISGCLVITLREHVVYHYENTTM